MAAEHRKKEEEERQRVRVLEGYFQRPYNKIDPELYKELRIVETRRSKLPGRPAIKREHSFFTLDSNHNYHHYKDYEADQKQNSNNQEFGAVVKSMF